MLMEDVGSLHHESSLKCQKGVCVADRTVAADTVYILELAAAAASEAVTVHVLSRQYQNSRYPEFK